jgi:hypothetical protein
LQDQEPLKAYLQDCHQRPIDSPHRLKPSLGYWTLQIFKQKSSGGEQLQRHTSSVQKHWNGGEPLSQEIWCERCSEMYHWEERQLDQDNKGPHCCCQNKTFHKRRDLRQSPLTTTKAKAIIIGLGSPIPAVSPFKKLLQIGRIALVQMHPTWFLLSHTCAASVHSTLASTFSTLHTTLSQFF